MRNFDHFHSWDETHLHFEVYTRKTDGSLKELRWDPFDLYGQVESYVTAFNQPARGLWLSGADGTPQFAV